MFPGTRCFPVGKTAALPCGSSPGSLGCAVGKEGMASSHLDKTRSFQVWHSGSKRPQIPGLFPNFIPFRSRMGRKCWSCARSGDTSGMPRPKIWSWVWEHLGMWIWEDLGRTRGYPLGKASRGDPAGAGMERSGCSLIQGGLRLQLGFVWSSFGIGIYPRAPPWSLLEQGQSGAIPVSGKLQQGGLAGSGML